MIALYPKLAISEPYIPEPLREAKCDIRDDQFDEDVSRNDVEGIFEGHLMTWGNNAVLLPRYFTTKSSSCIISLEAHRSKFISNLQCRSRTVQSVEESSVTV